MKNAVLAEIKHAHTMNQLCEPHIDALINEIDADKMGALSTTQIETITQALYAQSASIMSWADRTMEFDLAAAEILRKKASGVHDFATKIANAGDVIVKP